MFKYALSYLSRIRPDENQVSRPNLYRGSRKGIDGGEPG
jgi:hypothetical protein